MLYLPGGGAMLFLTDVDHVSFEKANETRQNNLQSATVSLQVVIGLQAQRNGGSFSFAVVRQIVILFFTYMLYGKFVDFIKI